MSTENTQDTLTAGGGSTESTSVNTVDTSSSPQTSVNSAPTPDINAAPGQAPSMQGAAPVVPATAQFTPNFKYKAALQEKELDPFFRDLIKDPESEKKVKDVFTRADAFEYIKDKYAKQEQDLTSVKNDYNNQTQRVSKVVSAVQKGDFESVFRNLQMNEHQVIQWAAKRVEYLQMVNGLPPAQRAEVERQQQAITQNQEYQEQFQSVQQQLQETKSHARTMHLDMALNKPDVGNAAKFWDEKAGYDGAFRDMVIEEAQREFHTKQIDLTPEQAIASVMKKFGKFIDVQSPMAPQMPGTLQNQMQAPQMPGQKPVIPAAQGSSKVPIRKQVRSLDDLKKLSKEMEAQG